MDKIPIWEKAALTIEEAALYSNIGINTLRKLTSDVNCDFVLYVGNRKLVKRKQFEKFLDTTYSI